MPKIPVSLATLKDLDYGRSAAAIDDALKKMFVDLDDRGNDKKERKVNITIAAGKLGDAPEIYIDVRVKTAFPTYDTQSTIARLQFRGPGDVGAEFTPEAPENPDQGTIDWELKQKAKEAARKAREEDEGETD